MDNSQAIQEPNELEAWKLMMDSMIKFIHASTRLMNTFNKKASTAVLPNACEVECIPCSSGIVQKPKVCAAAVSQQQAGKGQDDGPTESPDTSKRKSSTPAEKPAETPAETTPEDKPAEADPAEPKEESAEADSAEPKDESAEDKDPSDPKDEPGDIIDSSATEEPPAEKPKDEAPPEESADPQKSSRKSSLKEGVPKDNCLCKEVSEIKEESAEPQKSPRKSFLKEGVPKDTCVCKEVREIKETAKKAGVPVDPRDMTSEAVKDAGGEFRKSASESGPKKATCACKRDKASKEPKTADKAEETADCRGKCKCSSKKTKSSLQLCACPVTSKETTELTKTMVEKLAVAQSEIDGLKGELEKLQFLEFTKKSNTAALYKEIMKDTSVPTASCGGPKCTPTRLDSSQAPYSSTVPPIRGNRNMMNSTGSPNFSAMQGSGPFPMDMSSIAKSPQGGREFGTQYNATPPPMPQSMSQSMPQSMFQSTQMSPSMPQSMSPSMPQSMYQSMPQPMFRSLASSMPQTTFMESTGNQAPCDECSTPNTQMQSFNRPPTTTMQSYNESGFQRPPPPCEECSIPNTQMESFNESPNTQNYNGGSFQRPQAPCDECSTPNTQMQSFNRPPTTTMQSYNESSFQRPQVPYLECAPPSTMQNYNKIPCSGYAPPPNTAMQTYTKAPYTTGQGYNGNTFQRSPAAYPRTVTSDRWPDNSFMPSFDNIVTSSLAGLPQGNQSQLHRSSLGNSQMRRNEVECMYKKSRKKPTSPIANRGSSLINAGGRPMGGQLPIRSVMVTQARVVCTPPRTYADPPVYDDEEYLPEYDDQEYEDECDDINCRNDNCGF